MAFARHWFDLAAAGALTADLIWYRVGYTHGSRALGRLCWVRLEPDSCVRRVKNLLEKHGLRSLLVWQRPSHVLFAYLGGSLWLWTVWASLSGPRHLNCWGLSSRSNLKDLPSTHGG